MDIKDIVELAKIQEEALLAQKLTANELIALLALLEARIMRRVYQTTPSTQTSISETDSRGTAQATEVKKVPVEPYKPKPIKYDPVFDPPPPIEPDRVPERPVNTRVLANVNDACLCNACNKVSYVVNRIIRDGDKIPDFLASFTPVPGVQPLTRKIEVMNVDGQISTDCPLCGANKSLYLTGRPSHGV